MAGDGAQRHRHLPGPSGASEAALRHYEQARDLAQASGNAVPLASTLNNIATIEFALGRLESAEQGFRQSLHLSRGARRRPLGVDLPAQPGPRAGGRAQARGCARLRVEAEALLRGIGESVLKLELLEVAAGLASIRGEHEVAARFWGASRQRFIDAGYRRPTEDQEQLERLSAMHAQALGDAAFDRAEAAGRALDPDAAMLELRQWLAG